MLAVYSYYEITIYIKPNYTSFICIDVNLPDIYVCVCVCVCSYAFAHINNSYVCNAAYENICS